METQQTASSSRTKGVACSSCWIREQRCQCCLVRFPVSESQYKLYAANGSPIKTYGTRVLTINLGLKRLCTWEFCVAEVERPIIGADFLKKNGLVVDLRNRCLTEEVLRTKILGSIHMSIGSITTVTHESDYHKLLEKFPDIKTPRRTDVHAKHQVVHHIETRRTPVAEHSRRLAPDKLKIAKAEIDLMIGQGICRPSKSRYASPLHMVQKKNGD
ncbi:uncharacterized protein LOC107268526 [Cephus cinctus]|uniref:Uncharacterized protein LOC107268526 n=1 Tax=Cephus cinctus TaxID=211228 RepID=A0AAJ7FKY3_CEPCN|nr:uncharacterized protein LOC107268526 [Cephus cinctus]